MVLTGAVAGYVMQQAVLNPWLVNYCSVDVYYDDVLYF